MASVIECAMAEQDADVAQKLAYVRRIMAEMIPFNRLLGIEVVELQAGRAVLALPFRQELLGDPLRPALHGGVLSALADTCGGAAVWTAIGPQDRVSTIDLRVDYLLPGPPERMVAVADVLRVGNRVGVAAIRIASASLPHQVVAEGKGVYAVKRTEERG
ncbi:MAG: hotdog fold thioesterase [Polyangiaceae bacterium]|nr:hotdog fold thioesterase [Polyangiaceae bacterium]